MKNLINKYLGTPYKNSKEDTIGLDCWELVKLLYEEGLGITLSSYAPDNMPLFYEYWSKPSAMEFPWNKLKQWDLLLIHSLFYPVDHVAIVVDKENFVHTTKTNGCCVEKIVSHKHRVFQIARLRIMGEEYTQEEKEIILRPATYTSGAKFYGE